MMRLLTKSEHTYMQLYDNLMFIYVMCKFYVICVNNSTSAVKLLNKSLKYVPFLNGELHTEATIFPGIRTKILLHQKTEQSL